MNEQDNTYGLPYHEARERLASAAHEAWIGWMNYLFNNSRYDADGSIRVPVEHVVRWRGLMAKTYDELTPEQQESDRIQADIYLDALGKPEGNPSLLWVLKARAGTIKAIDFADLDQFDRYLDEE